MKPNAQWKVQLYHLNYHSIWVELRVTGRSPTHWTFCPVDISSTEWGETYSEWVKCSGRNIQWVSEMSRARSKTSKGQNIRRPNWVAFSRVHQTTDNHCQELLCTTFVLPIIRECHRFNAQRKCQLSCGLSGVFYCAFGWEVNIDIHVCCRCLSKQLVSLPPYRRLLFHRPRRGTAHVDCCWQVHQWTDWKCFMPRSAENRGHRGCTGPLFS